VKNTKLAEVDRSGISRQAQAIARKIKKSSSAEDKADAGLALSILALVSTQPEDSAAQQLLKLLKDLKI